MMPRMVQRIQFWMSVHYWPTMVLAVVAATGSLVSNRLGAPYPAAGLPGLFGCLLWSALGASFAKYRRAGRWFLLPSLAFLLLGAAFVVPQISTGQLKVVVLIVVVAFIPVLWASRAPS